MDSNTATSTKRALINVNDVLTYGVASKKAKKSKTTTSTTSAAAIVRANDIELIKSILGDIHDPDIKTALESIIQQPKSVAGMTKTVSPERSKKDEASLKKMTNTTIRNIQNLINDKLKWKDSYKRLTRNFEKKGGRIEVVCSEPEVFKRIFEGAAIKEGKDGKLSCSLQTDDEVENCNLPFKGKSYRYSCSYLCAPITASLKDGTLTFGFKFGII
jgi:hypothetical protein